MMMRNVVTLVLVSAITTAGALAHGYVTNRWKPRGEDASLVMPDVPLVLGEWRGEELPSGLANEPALRNLTRKYTHAKHGRVLTVSLTVGPAGLTSQHTPEYCYPGSGFQPIGDTTNFVVPGRTATTGGFRSAVYRKDKLAGGDPLRIVWAWSPNGSWTAPKYPELKFLTGNLYKLYVVSWAADQPLDQDAELHDFLTKMLASLDQALFAGSFTSQLLPEEKVSNVQGSNR